MLKIENSRGFNEMDSYPTYEYISAKGTVWNSDGSRMAPIAKGYREVIYYKDERFTEKPYGIYHGPWRNDRWMDEARRRGIA